MVKLTNGIEIIEVPSGSVSALKVAGFTVVESETDDNYEEEETTEEDDEIEELRNKPLSKWSKEDVKKFSKKNGISLPKKATLDEVKEIVREFIEG